MDPSAPGGGSQTVQQWLTDRTLFQEQLKKGHPELLAQVPAQVWKRGWVVDSRAAGSGEQALGYLARYVFKTATSNRQVPRLANGRLLWNYRESKTGQAKSMALEPLEWMSRFLQHLLPSGYARVRTFGWLHPAAKVRGNRVRALLGLKPWLTPAEQQTWQPPTPPPASTQAAIPAPTPAVPSRCAPNCPVCRRPMRLLGGWFAGEAPWLPPERPP
ncbi:MAG: transposase [Chloroflexi bacterium]|nr:transposase [Chloroflexota bacterium]